MKINLCAWFRNCKVTERDEVGIKGAPSKKASCDTSDGV